MKNAKTDRLLRVGMGLLMVVLVYVIYAAIHQRVVVAGDDAPEFSVRADNGRTVSLSNFGGKVLVLNFWASWCPPCIEETPSLNAFADQMGPKGVVVLGVSIDRNQDSYKKFIAKYGIQFDTSEDPEADVSTSYGTFQIPETYIIDQSGKVVEKIISNQNFMDPEFLQHIQKML
jgi:peroxiredoxin